MANLVVPIYRANVQFYRLAPDGQWDEDGTSSPVSWDPIPDSDETSETGQHRTVKSGGAVPAEHLVVIAGEWSTEPIGPNAPDVLRRFIRNPKTYDTRAGKWIGHKACVHVSRSYAKANARGFSLIDAEQAATVLARQTALAAKPRPRLEVTFDDKTTEKREPRRQMSFLDALETEAVGAHG